MIDIDNLHIKHYCHPKCEPYKNICRLPKNEAFSLAYKLAEAEPDSTSLERFSVSHFENYFDWYTLI